MTAQIILSLSILVGVHELGHLVAAKVFGMRVEQYSIGFPPKLFGVKYLVVNALRRETHISHFTLSEAISLIEELSPRTGYLTHISHQMGPNAALEKELPSRIRPAYDGLVLDV